MSAHVVTVDGKAYIVHAPRAWRTLGGGVVVGYHYWSTRNGDYFGPQRIASTGGKGRVAREIVAQAQVLFGADHDALIASVQ